MWKFIEWLVGRPAAKPAPPPEALARQYPSPQPAHANASQGYPNAYVPDEDGAEIFDPALRHCIRAFRRGDPRFTRPEDAQRWYAARAAVTDHVLRRIARSPWQSRLVLRGSCLMRAQIGEAARAPGDIDWIVRPAGLEPHMPSGREIINEIAELVPGGEVGNNIVIGRYDIARDAIWTYDRGEGLRLTFTWRCGELVPGRVQLDFVFGEPLVELAEEAEVPLSDGTAVTLLTAPPQLALCWKLVWLCTDSFPQGKDLYDAVLLAERHGLSADLLQTALAPAIRDGAVVQLPPDVKGWHVDWDNFLLECPWIEGDLAHWKQRLASAIAPAYVGETAAVE